MTAELVVAIVAIIISLCSLFWTMTVHEKGLERERKLATLEAYNRLQNEVLDEINLYTKKQIKEIALDSHSEQYKKVSALLARCNHFAIGVSTDIYDIEIVKKIADEYLVYVYEKLWPMIEMKRSINKNVRHYSELEKLALSLKRK